MSVECLFLTDDSCLVLCQVDDVMQGVGISVN